MRIHSVSFQAFGPFPGHHTVDIDALGTGGLFLIEGPTGSGKSMILDAIFYGLYGKVAGLEADEGRLRSQYAPPTTATFVEVIFSTAHGVYKVRRSPRYLRPKQRGQGVTEQKSQASLWRLSAPDDRSGEPLATKEREVGIELGRILPLSSDQFRQTVILPQGAFAQFLHDKSADRALLLQRVFGTEIFARAQLNLHERAKDANGQRKALTESVRAQAEHIAHQCETFGIAGASAILSEAAEGGDVADLPDALDPFVDRLAAEHAVLAERSQAAQASSREAAATLAQVTRLADLQRRGIELRNRQAQLAQQAGRIDALRDALTRSQQAQPLAQAWAAADRSRQAADHAHRDATRARDGLATLDPAGLEAEVAQALASDATPGYGLLADAALTRKQTLVEAAERQAQERQALATLAQVTAQTEQVAQQIEQARKGAARLPAKIAMLTARADQARKAQADRAELAQQIAASHRLLDAAAAWERDKDALQAAAAEVGRTRRVADARLQEYDEVHGRWRAQASADLAGELEQGQACPVCGSIEHPQPAQPAAGGATFAEVQAAMAAVEKAQAAFEAAQNAHVQAGATLEADTGRLEGHGPAEIRAMHEQLLARDTELEVQASDEHAATTQLEQAHEAEKAFAEQQSQLAQQYSALQARIVELTKQKDDLAARNAAFTGDLAAQSLACGTLAEQARRVADLLQAAQRAAQEATRDSAEAQRMVESSPFTDRAAAEAASLTPDQVRDHQRQIRDFDDQRAACADGLRDPAVRAAWGRVLPLKDAWTATRKRLDLTAQTLRDAAAEKKSQKETAAESVAELRQAIRRRAAAIADTEALTRMDELASGGSGNLHHTPLATWVLLSRLDDVLAVANPMLSDITSGRYELVQRPLDQAKKATQTLAIDVIDHQEDGDQVRPNATLSGGETFYCSLALALALTEIVTAEAGGVEIGTMFIDEGFGTLDSETLERVLAQLRRSSGDERSVGIISHIDAVSQHINDRIEVRRIPGTQRSTLSVRV